MFFVKYFKQLDNLIKKKEMSRYDISVPEQYWSNFIRVSGASDVSYVFKKLLGEAFYNKQLKCLVIGVFGGRDYWNFKVAGHDVYGLDLERVSDCPNTKKGNAEEEWPFDDHEFDVVIMAEVLEHFIFDLPALREARRVLRPSGQLLVTVPYFDSKAPYHVRMHDPRSIKKLLQIAGFHVDNQLDRPGIFTLTLFNYINFILALIWFGFTQKSAYSFLTKCYGAIEWKLGQQKWIPRKLLKLCGFINWGGIMKCSISDQHFDYLNENISEFVDSSVSRDSSKL